MPKKLTTQDFIEKAIKIHGNNYDYSLVEYKNCYTKIKIVCQKHGIFEQSPDAHIYENGCSKCSGFHIHNEESFINKAIETHGNKYDYSLVVYENNKIKIKIICPIHGIFEQRAGAHIASKHAHGCPKCDNSKKLTIEEFINKAIKIHGNKYDYSNVEYISARNYVTIICPNHGKFQQLAKVHINNHGGCPTCNESKGEKFIKEFFIKNNISFIPQYKFENCRHKYQLSFDFFIPDYNTCIEYDGPQHFYAIDYFGGDNTFINIQLRDKIKNDYCQKNNINMKRIKYNSNVDKELRLFFKKI